MELGFHQSFREKNSENTGKFTNMCHSPLRTIHSVLNLRYQEVGILLNTFYSRGLYFRVNSQEYRGVKIKSSPIISYVRIIEEDMTYRENKVS